MSNYSSGTTWDDRSFTSKQLVAKPADPVVIDNGSIAAEVPHRNEERGES